MLSLRLFWILLAALPPQAQTQNTAATKPPQSAITIHVYKTGLFSGLAHNHLVIAPIARAAIDPVGLKAEIAVMSKEMKVADPEISDKDRAEIQGAMLGPKVLDAAKYPEIRFKSLRIEQASPQHYRVWGTLDLHGTSKELSFEVSGGPERYHAATRLKQSDFGIKPISLFGGAVKVKDELDLEFDVYPAAPPAMKK